MASSYQETNVRVNKHEKFPFVLNNWDNQIIKEGRVDRLEEHVHIANSKDDDDDNLHDDAASYFVPTDMTSSKSKNAQVDIIKVETTEIDILFFH